MRELSFDQPFNCDLNDDPGLDAGEAEPRVLDGEEEVDQEDNARDDGQYTHRYTRSPLACKYIQRKEEAITFIFVYWNLHQDVFSGILSSSTFSPLWL